MSQYLSTDSVGCETIDQVADARMQLITDEVRIIVHAQSQLAANEQANRGAQAEPLKEQVVFHSVDDIEHHSDSDASILTQSFNYFCPFEHCDFQSAKRISVACHIKGKHGSMEVGAVRKCPHCEHATAHVSNLRTHILARHSQHRPWLCDQCGKKFADKSYYNAHMKRHRNDLRYSCTLCDGRFLLPSHLVAHMMSRHGKKTHSANSVICQYSTLDDRGQSVEDEHDAERASDEAAPLQNCLQQTYDHDYIRSSVPVRNKTCLEIFECLECSSFFVSFDSLKNHTYAEHRPIEGK